MTQLKTAHPGFEKAAPWPADRSNLSQPETFLSDESTLELVVKARGGDRDALEALLQRCLPQLRRWAHGRLPACARGYIDTVDLVQDVAIRALERLEAFEPRHVGAMQAYLRKSVINRIRDEMRRNGRHPAPVELPEDHPSDRTSPLELAIESEAYQRYRDALARLRLKDRELVVARIEAQWSVREIAHRFGITTVEAARMAVVRALQRLVTEMRRDAEVARSGAKYLHART